MPTFIHNEPPQFIHISAAPAPRPSRADLGIRLVGSVLFQQLAGVELEDLERAWRRKYRRSRAARPPADLRIVRVEVSPHALLRFNTRMPIVRKDKLLSYVPLWRSGSLAPAIVIDSSSSMSLLLEGRHRTASAAASGVDRISALDLGF